LETLKKEEGTREEEISILERDGYVFLCDCVDVFSYTANSPAILPLPIKLQKYRLIVLIVLGVNIDTINQYNRVIPADYYLMKMVQL